MEPKGVEEYICYQRSYSLGFKWFHTKLGLTLAIEIKHQHMMNNLSVFKSGPKSNTLPQVARVFFPSTLKSSEFPYTKYLIG